ncbi:MAG: hypothetical protein PHQ23_04635 [Candidatus Wallbacteria bacterium]|nr:hypothetical protein [Candidatus Wallbacteria bacterium]
MKKIDPKILEQRREIELGRHKEMMEDSVYEAISLLADEIKGKTVMVSNSKFPNARKTVRVEDVKTNYVPGRSLRDKFIELIEDGKQAVKLDVPSDIRVKGNRFTFDYSEPDEDRAIQRSFKKKGVEYLEVYLEII